MAPEPFAIVQEVVMTKRRAGAKAPHAVADAAADLDTSPRWIMSMLRNEPHAIKPWRAAKLITRYREWLAREIEKNEQIVAQQREMLARMERDADGTIAEASGRAGVECFAVAIG